LALTTGCTQPNFKNLRLQNNHPSSLSYAMRFLLIILLLPFFSDAQNPAKGGIGITFKADSSGYVKVVSVRKNYPADKAGIKPNDLIVKINNLPVYKIVVDTIVSYLSGEVGSTVTVHVKRNGKLADITMKRVEKTDAMPVSLKVENETYFGDSVAFTPVVQIDNNSWEFLATPLYVYRLDEINHSCTLVFTDEDKELKTTFPQLDTIWNFPLAPDHVKKGYGLDYVVVYANNYTYRKLKDLLEFSSDMAKYEALLIYTKLPTQKRVELAKNWSKFLTDIDNYLFTYPVDLLEAGEYLGNLQMYNVDMSGRNTISFRLANAEDAGDKLIDLVQKTKQSFVVKQDYSIDTIYAKMIENSVNANDQLRNSRGVPVIPGVYDAFKFSLAELKNTLTQWKQPVGMLVYTLSGDNLHVLYLNNKGRSDTAVIPLTTSQLTGLEISLKKAVKGKAFTASRGGEVNNTGPSINADSLCNAISLLLLPPQFHLEELNHLVICPAYNLSAFPFSMLKVKDSFLIDRFSYSITPSIKEFIINGYNADVAERGRYSDQLSVMGTRALRSPAEWSKAVFIADPYNTGEAQTRFAKLPGAKREIEMLRGVVPNSLVLSGKNAVKSKILSAIPDADLVYFATHGIADAKDPLNKSFVLVGGDLPDACLTAKEIQQQSLKAMLVVLSACQTGLGHSHEGGMIGIARAFQLAGAKNVLMSLWDISDNKTPELMKYFFEELYSKKNYSFFPYDAFRTAVIRFKKQNPDPEYWAAFSMFGVPY
jgi:CHAT domain-containing protein